MTNIALRETVLMVVLNTTVFQAHSNCHFIKPPDYETNKFELKSPEFRPKQTRIALFLKREKNIRLENW
jgi:hypothetical protein